ncbi:MAG: hypothetical protein JST54_00975 [Deltaproteobacteria bacterium]|nr:hypothetical protein [Deltaproteobacteria bacterium]
MRTLALAVFAAFALVACSSGGSDTNTDAGSSDGGPCNAIVVDICQKAVSCSAGNDAGIVFLVGPDVDAGVHGFEFSLRDSAGNNEAGCENVVGTACGSSKEAGFTASCGAAVDGGLACGTDPTYGNGMNIPAACWNSI